MQTISRSNRKRQRGVAAVELGIMSTLLVTLLLGGSEFGRAMVQYNTLVKGTRAATRYLSQFPPGDATSITAAKNLVLYGSTAGGGALQVPGLTAAMVTVCDATSCAGSSKRQFTGQTYVNLVTVTITGVQFQSLATWLLPNFTFDTINATMSQGVG